MNQIKQTVYGNNNSQVTKIFDRPFDPVDICAHKIGEVLATIAHIDFLQPQPPRLLPPDIDAKNIANAIDSANAIEIEQTYALWDEITEAISADDTGGVENDYLKSAYILNQLYLAKFIKDFPGFKIHTIGVYCQSVGASLDEVHTLVHLIHYMYLSCQVGLRP